MGGRTWARWTHEEDELVRRHYPEHGAMWDGWAELLPAHPKAPAIRSRARALGVRAGEGVQLANNRASRKRTGYGEPRLSSPVMRSGPVRTSRTKPTKPCGEPWTEEQHYILVHLVRAMGEKTGHPVLECFKEWMRLKKADKGE